MTEDTKTRWVDIPIIGQYTTIDFARTGLALIFIMMCIIFITLYIHKSVDESTKNKLGIHTEYVNMTRDHVYDQDNNLVVKAPDLVIDKIIEFPISYNKLDMQGYVLIDTATNIKYLYLRNAFGITITRYWPGREIITLGGDVDRGYNKPVIGE